MFVPVERSADKEKNYRLLLENLPHYIDRNVPWYATLANAASVIDYFLPDVNWVGFYIMEDDVLYLGPFQGLAGCMKILPGQGVCGTAAERKETVVVDDVHAFEGHITCDTQTESEIVVPLVKEERIVAVLDIDSPKKARFDETDRKWLKKVSALVVDNLR